MLEAPALKIEVGEPWTPEQFTKQALKIEHPFDVDGQVEDSVSQAVFDILVRGREETSSIRKEGMAYYR